MKQGIWFESPLYAPNIRKLLNQIKMDKNKHLLNDLVKTAFINFDEDDYEVDSIAVIYKKASSKKNGGKCKCNHERTSKAKSKFKSLLLLVWKILKYATPFILKWMLYSYISTLA
jgi:hypothetical protein